MWQHISLSYQSSISEEKEEQTIHEESMIIILKNAFANTAAEKELTSIKVRQWETACAFVDIKGLLQFAELKEYDARCQIESV